MVTRTGSEQDDPAMATTEHLQLTTLRRVARLRRRDARRAESAARGDVGGTGTMTNGPATTMTASITTPGCWWSRLPRSARSSPAAAAWSS